ncbi:MAG: helix-turn-helix transcriptional regulator [Verrucomicrobia bacterium]|jgi:AraC-like DNA-binding protein|nr:helix-turn-helix transcriptional regulator [Verrucomicrobiota bacterium]
MYHTVTGPWWDTEGRAEGQILHHIEIPLSGHRQVVHGQNVLDLMAGHVYFLPGNTPVAGRHIEDAETIWVRFRCEWLPGVDPLMDWPERTPCILDSTDTSTWRKWLDQKWGANTNHALELRSRIEHWLAEGVPSLDGIIDRHREAHAQFEAVFEFVEAKLGADLRVDELANVYGTTPYTFTRVFSSATKSTPKAYLNRRLNLAAIQLIIGSDLSMKEIAYRLRFSDEFYFSRFFKKLNGVAPSLYRKRLRA